MARRIDSDAAISLMRSADLEPLIGFIAGHLPWKCSCMKCGKVVTPSYANVKNGHAGCAYCSGKAVDPKDAFNFMVTKGLLPREQFKSVRNKWLCRCMKCNETVSTRYGDIKRGQGGCLKCGYLKSAFSNTLDANVATEIMLANRLRPLEPYKKNDAKWLCECIRCGERVTPTLHSVSSGQGGCIFCGRNDAAEKRKTPEVEAISKMKKHGYEPLENFVGVSQPWKSRHLECGEIVRPRLASLKSGNGGCKSCGYKAAADKNRFTEEEAVKIMKSIGLRPLESYTNVFTKWKCEHLPCGSVVYPQLQKIQNGQRGCRKCGFIQSAAKNRRDEGSVVLEMLAADLQPLAPYEGTEAKWKCRCLKCGKVVFPRHHSVLAGQGGCKYCAKKGMDFSAPGYVYLVVHHEFDALKVGIGGIEKRIKDHTDQGWVLVKRWNFITGHKASLAEEKTLKHLRNDKGLKHYLSKQEMPQAGHTETFSLDEVSITYVRDYLDRITKTKASP